MDKGESQMKCPKCDNPFEDGFLYMRGIGGSLFWSRTDSTRFFSRKNLSQLDLGRLSKTPVGGQAVLPAYRCSHCGMAMFDTDPG